MVVGNRGAGVLLRVVRQVPTFDETAVKLLVADADDTFSALLRTETDGEAVHATSRRHGVRPVAFVHRRDVPYLAVVDQFALRQSDQPLTGLIVTPISVHDAVARTSAESEQHRRQ